MNATKKLLTDELVPKVSLRLNDHVEGLVNAKDAKINHLEEKNEQLEGLINRLQQQVEVLQVSKNHIFLFFIYGLCHKLYHTVRNLHFLSKNST